MFTKDNFYIYIANLCKAYRIKEDHKSYPTKDELDFLFVLLETQKMTDELFRKTCFKMALDATSGNTFTLPLVGDFLEVAKLNSKSTKAQAEEQAELVFGSMAKFCGISNVQFEDPVTNYTVSNNFGGVDAICWDYSPANPKIKNISFARRSFADAWMVNAERGNKQHEPCKTKSPVNSGVISYVGNKEAGLLMLEQSKLQIEHKPNDKQKGVADITAALAKKMKVVK